MNLWPTRDILPQLDSLTKYPSIPTYHTMGERGRLLPAVQVQFPEHSTLFITEKVDGTNARIIVFPDGRFIIGGRDSLLHASGDLIYTPDMHIVETLVSHSWTKESVEHSVRVLFVEVYGAEIGKHGQSYTSKNARSWRVFDIVDIPLSQYAEMMAKTPSQIAAWREAGGQKFHCVNQIYSLFAGRRIETCLGAFPERRSDRKPLVPFVGNSYKLPTDIAETLEFMKKSVGDTSLASLDDGATAKPEGIVVRTEDRSTIAKLRFEDYHRTLKSTELRTKNH